MSLPSSFGKLKVPITSTWSFGFTIPETAAAPVTLTDIARICFLTSAESRCDDGLPPSTSFQNSTSPFWRITAVLLPITERRSSYSTACPTRPSLGAHRGSISSSERTVPAGTSFLNTMTFIVP